MHPLSGYSEELFATVTQFPTSFVLLHGAFARPARRELMEVAALRVGAGAGDGFYSLVRCEFPDVPPQDLTADGSAVEGISEEENQSAPVPAELFAELDEAFGLSEATVIMWGGMAYRFAVCAEQQQFTLPWFQTRVIDLQAAVVLHFDLKTSQCKDPRSVLRALDLEQAAEFWSLKSVSVVRAMQLITEKLLADGWTPESTPDALIDGCDIGEDAEAMRVDRWEQIRERQNNLGVHRRPVPDITPAFIILDGEHVSLRYERLQRLIEVALVVAWRGEQADYVLSDKSFTSLVQLRQIKDTNSYAWTITAIDPKEVQQAPPLPRVLDAMMAAAPWDEGVLVTWGPDDARIITQNCVEARIPSPITEVPLVDLQRAFSRYYELGAQQVSLEKATSMLGIDTSHLELHRALADTLVTWYEIGRAHV